VVTGWVPTSDWHEGRLVKTILTCALLWIKIPPTTTCRIWLPCARVATCGATGDSTSKARTGTSASGGP